MIKTPQTVWLKQQKFIFSQFWSLKVQDEGDGRFDFSQGFPSWLADDSLLAVSSQGPFFWPGVSSLYKDTSHMELGPYPYDLIWRSCKYSHMGKVRVSTNEGEVVGVGVEHITIEYPGSSSFFTLLACRSVFVPRQEYFRCIFLLLATQLSWASSLRSRKKLSPTRAKWSIVTSLCEVLRTEVQLQSPG